MNKLKKYIFHPQTTTCFTLCTPKYQNQQFASSNYQELSNRSHQNLTVKMEKNRSHGTILTIKPLQRVLFDSWSKLGYNVLVLILWGAKYKSPNIKGAKVQLTLNLKNIVKPFKRKAYQPCIHMYKTPSSCSLQQISMDKRNKNVKSCQVSSRRLDSV